MTYEISCDDILARAGLGDSRPVHTDDPRFEPIWQVIKAWDIARVPGMGYAGANGTDVQIILDALDGLNGGSDDQLRDDIEHLTQTAQHARAESGACVELFLPDRALPSDRTIAIAVELEGIAREKEAELARRAADSTRDRVQAILTLADEMQGKRCWLCHEPGRCSCRQMWKLGDRPEGHGAQLPDEVRWLAVRLLEALDTIDRLLGGGVGR